jgi:FkbM family methyltransferase
MAAVENDLAGSEVAQVREMSACVQRLGLRLYRWARMSGVLSTALGERLFEWCYDRYKGWFEAGDINVLSSFIEPGATVVDVGANIGFFARHFAHWVGESGHVLAIEPEVHNFARLTHLVLKCGLQQVVEPIRGAACDRDGEIRLHVDPFHPAGHYISHEGVVVRAYTLDRLLSERGWPHVGLVKIDVQGAEERVLRGAREVLSRFHPALFMEVDESALLAMSSVVDRLLRLLGKYRYRAYHLKGGEVCLVWDRKHFDAWLGGGYTDFLFLANPGGGRDCVPERPAA